MDYKPRISEAMRELLMAQDMERSSRIASVEFKLNPPKVFTAAVEVVASDLGYCLVRELGSSWRLPRPNEFFGATVHEALEALKESLDDMVSMANVYAEALKT